VIVGTAGHVDHGKTSLVRALTGVDTDRLPEEKARGISIDLGFAYQALGNGQALGFVDVPGHERFVHTMLAGAAGIDLALLVVAADDGVMPQTREHAAILHLLGVRDGIVAISKIDRVDAARVAQVERDVRSLLAPTPLSDASVVPVSTRHGTGLESLAQALRDSAGRVAAVRRPGRFRLAVDRSFALAGHGTVVTGTVFSGTVRVGDRLAIAPSGQPVRVRSLHAQNSACESAGVGTRCALQLAGVARDEVARGDWVTHQDAVVYTVRFDARLRLLADEPRPLGDGTRVHLHVGAAHVPARIALLEGANLAPGGAALVQCVTDEPIACWHGDRYVIRDASARRTMGGGEVLDPYAPARRRRSAERLRFVGGLEGSSLEQVVSGLIENAPFGVDLEKWSRALGADLEVPLARLSGVLRTRAGDRDIVITTMRWEELSQALLAGLERFHADNPEESGVDRLRLRRMVLPDLDVGAWGGLVDALADAGRLTKSGPWLHLPWHVPRLSEADIELVPRLLQLLRGAGFDPPWVRDLAAATGTPEDRVRALLRRLARRGQVFQVVRDLFYPEALVANLASVALSLESGRGALRAADFRDATGLGRKRAIQILEYFDRVGFTRRVRDDHVVRGDGLRAMASSARPEAAEKGVRG